MTWPNIQQDFTSAMLHNESELLAAHISKHQKAKQARMDIYRRNIMLTLTDALAENYRAIAALVGDAFFAQMAEQFIADCPPGRANMNVMGEDFPKWIAQYKPAEALPYLPDIARFEYAWNSSFFAKRAEARPQAFWVDADPEILLNKTLSFRDDVQLVQTQYPCDALWKYCVRDKGEGEIPELIEGTYYFMLHRPERKVIIEPLSASIWKWLHSLAIKGSMAEVLHEINDEEEQAEVFQLILSHLIAHQLIKDEQGSELS